MHIKEIIKYLNDLLIDPEIGDHEKEILKEAIKRLNKKITKEDMIEIAKLIATILDIGSKFF